MKKAIQERNIAVGLFVLVMIVFSFAERDSKKIVPLYTKGTLTVNPVKATVPETTSTAQIATISASGQN